MVGYKSLRLSSPLGKYGSLQDGEGGIDAQPAMEWGGGSYNLKEVYIGGRTERLTRLFLEL